jgi:Predicted enzyme related to lactoylglutathione lyase
MQNPFFHGVGGVLSADIAVPDHEQVLRFYSQVLTTGPDPLWQEDLINNQGTPIIGLGARSPEYEALPLQWMPHFQVVDIAASAARTLELGGQELMHGKSDDGQSQWAVLVDPSGAAFGVIPVVASESIAQNHPDRIGRISGLSLVAADVSSICEFYEQVIGWVGASVKVENGIEMRRPDGICAAKIYPMNDDKAMIPCVWILSLPVSDFDESLRRVREAGGKVVRIVNEQRHAVIQDPVGVYIALQGNE